MCYQAILNNDLNIFALNILLSLFSFKDVVDVATVLAGIAAAVSSYLGFQALVEVRKQRETTYQPEIILSGGLFSMNNVPLTRTTIPFPAAIPWEYTYEVKDKDYQAPFTNRITPLPINVYNIGLGAAKNVTISCETDVNEWLAIYNKLAEDIEGELPFVFTYIAKDKILQFKSAKYVGTGSMWLHLNSLPEVVNHLLPSSIEREPYKFILPSLIFYFITALTYMDFYTQVAGKPTPKFRVPSPLPNIYFDVRYLDIADKKIGKKFVARIHTIGHSVALISGQQNKLVIEEIS
jgi:hypothetical protein